MDKKPPPLSLPFWKILLLALCIGCLAMHFLTESLGSSTGVTVASEVAGHFDDDHFVLNSYGFFPSDELLVSLMHEQILNYRSMGLVPLLPPPNI